MNKEEFEKILAEVERLKAEAFNNGKNRRSLVTDVANSQRIAICEQLLHFIKSLPVEQPSEDLEKAAKEYVKENCILPEDCNDGDIPYYEECTAAVFKDGAQWQKEQSTKLLKTIYSDCDNLKKDLDRVTTGNLPHRIGNIKFSITCIQVIIKQAMEDEQ